MRLLLGLGNPGEEYVGTRHNVGFDLLDRLAAELQLRFLARGRSLVARGEGVLLAKPQTYMNRSGRALADLLAEAEGAPELLVAYDDFHIPFGRLRCRPKGSHAGQKGMASILGVLGHEDVPRLRIGIGEPPTGVPAEDFVLMRFTRSEAREMDELLDRAVPFLRDWLADGDLAALAARANAA